MVSSSRRSNESIAERTFFEVLLGGMDELQSDELEPTSLEPGDDVSDESPLDTIGLKNASIVRSVQSYVSLAVRTLTMI